MFDAAFYHTDTEAGLAATPLILFGAFDRHNFGDLLFAHVAAAVLPGRDCLYAGLAARDLTAYGGHRVEPLEALIGRHPQAPVVHAGGEILTVDAWQAAVMLLPPEEAQPLIRRLDADARARRDWACARLGIARHAPYVAPPALCPGGAVFDAVGGCELDRCDPALRDEVLAALRAARCLGVRDAATLGQLAAAGIPARLMPDPAVLVAELFGPRIRAAGAQGEPAAVRAAFPRGYLAVQFAAEFGDDATLAVLAGQLDALASATGCGVALFRAGAAPWHDELGSYRRLQARLAGRARVFESLALWDICALIAGSRGYCGSSLHGRIVAAAHALPHASVVPSLAGVTKQQAWAQTWEPDAPAVTPDRLAGGFLRSYEGSRAARADHARMLAERYREGCAWLVEALGGTGG
jgi:hypothetical protein